MTAYPILVESCDAPITAIDRGVKYSIGTGIRSLRSTAWTVSETITRASTAQAPDSYSLRGLISNSTMCSFSSKKRQTFPMIRTSVSSSRGFAPRYPVISGYALISRTICRISSSVTGRIRSVTSFMSSTIVPPIPKVMTLPNAGSVLPPMISSRPGSACCSTITPSICAPGSYAFALSMILVNAPKAAFLLPIPTITPPASLL